MGHQKIGQLATRDLTVPFAISLLVGLLLAVASVIGAGSNRLYGTTVIHPVVSRGGDVANLLVGVPLLLGALWLSRHGSVLGLLLWPGALFYVTYTYSLYLVTAPFNGLFPFYVLLVSLSAYTLIAIMAGIDGAALRAQLVGEPVHVLGGALISVSLLAMAGLTWQVVAGLTSTPLTEPAIGAPAIAIDYIVGSAPLLIGGILLWRRQALGYASAAGLLLVSAAGGVAFALSEVFQQVLTGAAMDVPTISIHLSVAAVSCGFLVSYLRRVARHASRKGRSQDRGAPTGRGMAKGVG